MTLRQSWRLARMLHGKNLAGMTNGDLARLKVGSMRATNTNPVRATWRTGRLPWYRRLWRCLRKWEA